MQVSRITFLLATSSGVSEDEKPNLQKNKVKSFSKIRPWKKPVVVGFEDKDGCCNVEHDFPGHEGLPGELDHRLVGHVRQQVSVELPIALENLDEKLAIVEEVDDPVNGVDNVDDPGEVVDDVQKRIFVLDRLDGLIGVEDEEEDEPEKVQEAKDCAPVAPEKISFLNYLDKFVFIWACHIVSGNTLFPEAICSS